MSKRPTHVRISRIFFSFMLLVVCGTMVADDCCPTDCTTENATGSCCPSCSRSFLRHRPTSQDMSLQYGLQKYYLHHQKDADFMPLAPKNGENEKAVDYSDEKRLFSMQTNVFYHQSTRKKRLGEYFTKECKCALRVAQTDRDYPQQGAISYTDPQADINSLWLELAGDISLENDNGNRFISDIALRPQRKVLGIAWNVHFDFDDYLSNTWMDIFVPLVHVRHHHNLQECVIAGRGQFADPVSDFTAFDATDAFNNPALCFGKIPCGVKSKTGIDDLKFTFGWHFWQKEKVSSALYMNLFVPTFRGSRAEYLMEPTIGTGGHVGLGLGLNGDWTLHEGVDTKLTWFNDVRYAYFFKHCEQRSFDLCKNGEWSRYMLVAREDALSTELHAINFLTRAADVTPRSNVEFLSMMHFEHNNFNFEFGYNFWYRQKEKIELKCGKKTKCCGGSNGKCCANDEGNVGIFDMMQRITAVQGATTTNSCATIEQAFTAPKDETAVFIQDSDLNLNSARVPASYTSKVFIAMGYDYELWDKPAMLGIGFSYEFSHKKSGYDQWGLWLKKGMSF